MENAHTQADKVRATLRGILRAERGRFCDKKYRLLTVKLSDVEGSLTFFEKSVGRCIEAQETVAKVARVYIDLINEGSAGQSQTPAEDEMMHQLMNAQQEFQYEAEVAYLLGKVLLDRLAMAFKFYFGPGKHKHWSFSTMCQYVQGFCRKRDLPEFCERLMVLMNAAKSDIAEFRDKYVAHKDPTRAAERERTVIAFGINSKGAHLQPIIVDPEPGHEPVPPGQPPLELLKTTVALMDEVLGYMQTNSAKADT